MHIGRSCRGWDCWHIAMLGFREGRLWGVIMQIFRQVDVFFLFVTALMFSWYDCFVVCINNIQYLLLLLLCSFPMMYFLLPPRTMVLQNNSEERENQ